MRIRDAEGDDWHAVLATREMQARGGPGELIGSGTYDEVYQFCKNHWHYGEVSSKPRRPAG